MSLQIDFQISPYEGVGNIKLGMNQDEVRKAIGTDFKPFMKTPQSEMPTDHFIGKGIHVYYKMPGFCKAIEMFPPANPTFRGSRLMELPFSQLAAYFKLEDSLVKIEDFGLTSLRFGINLFVPDLDESQESPVKAIIVFEKGYYDYKY